MQTLNGPKIGDIYELHWGGQTITCIVEEIKVPQYQEYMEDVDKGQPCVYLANIGKPTATRNVVYEYTWRQFVNTISKGYTKLVSRV